MKAITQVDSQDDYESIVEKLARSAETRVKQYDLDVPEAVNQAFGAFSDALADEDFDDNPAYYRAIIRHSPQVNDKKAWKAYMDEARAATDGVLSNEQLTAIGQLHPDVVRRTRELLDNE